MNQEDILIGLDKMIVLNNDPSNDEIWISADIYKNLNIKEYKGYKLYTSPLMPEEYMVIGKMFYDNNKRKCNCWLEIDTCYCKEDKENSNLCGKCQGNKDCYCK